MKKAMLHFLAAVLLAINLAGPAQAYESGDVASIGFACKGAAIVDEIIKAGKKSKEELHKVGELFIGVRDCVVLPMPVEVVLVEVYKVFVDYDGTVVEVFSIGEDFFIFMLASPEGGAEA